MIYDGEINAALTAGPEPLPERIDQWVLFEERLLLLAAPDHQLAAFESVPIAKLAEASWLEREECGVAQMLGKLGLGIDQVRIAHRGRHEGHLQYLVEAGLGVMLVAEHAPRLPTLVARLVEGDGLKQAIRLIVIAGRRYSPALDAFIKILRLRDWHSLQKNGEQHTGPVKVAPRSVRLDRHESGSSNAEA